MKMNKVFTIDELYLLLLGLETYQKQKFYDEEESETIKNLKQKILKIGKEVSKL